MTLKILIYSDPYQKWVDAFKKLNVEAKQVMFENTEVVYDSDKEKLEISILGDKKYSFDGILWRVAHVRPFKFFFQTLYTVKLSNIPTLNNVDCIIKCSNKLMVYSFLKKLKLPLISLKVYSTGRMLPLAAPQIPCVVKVGTYHAGLNKFLVTDGRQWNDLKSIVETMEDFVVIEPYIEVEEDIRLIKIGDEIYGLKRKGVFWKSNLYPESIEFFPVDEEMSEMVWKASEIFEADVCALDLLIDKKGNIHILEFVDVPGFEFLPHAYDKVAKMMVKKIKH